MPIKLNKQAYQKLIEEDLDWLQKQPRSLERDHITAIVEHSVQWYYPEEPNENH